MSVLLTVVLAAFASFGAAFHALFRLAGRVDRQGERIDAMARSSTSAD